MKNRFLQDLKVNGMRTTILIHVYKYLLLVFLLSFGLMGFGQAPTITSFSPISGTIGTLVTITGTNLATPTSINIGGVPAIRISSTSTSLVAMVMPGANTGTINVANASGNITSGSNFTKTVSSPPNTQQGNKLVGTGAIGGTGQGRSVSISADGNTAIVGGPSDNNGQGAAWIYIRNGNTWSQQGNKLVGIGAIGNSRQGTSVSISADGNTSIVGGPTDNGGIGASWIFTRNGGIWSQQGNKLVGTGTIGNAEQGGSVSISADGNTAIVGGTHDNSFKGAAWIFTRNGGIWSQQGNKLVGTGTGTIGNAEQGGSVSISADGNTSIVGGRNDNGGIGAVWIFTRNGGVWNQQGSKLVGMGVSGQYSQQGASVSISADGNTAIVGGKEDNNFMGAVWLFIRNGNTWSQQGNKLVGTGANGTAVQGESVSISADGNIAIVGGVGDNATVGAAWVYTRSGSTWTQQGNKLLGTGASGQSAQGGSVSLSADGNTAIVGGLGDNFSIGAAWVFSYATQPPTISSFSPSSGSIGTLVTINGTNLDNLTGITIGGVSAIRISSTSTSLVAMVMPGANTGTINVANASGNVTSGNNFNKVAFVPPTAQQGNKLVGIGNVGNSWQGNTIAISADGNTAIVGGYNDNGGIGAVWVYSRNGSTWTQQGNKLVGTGSIGTNVYQGRSISLSADGNTAIVGGDGDDGGIGATWVFTRSGSAWTQQGSKLVGTGYIQGFGYTVNQGRSVSLSADGNTAIVGGSNDGIAIGAAWVFTRNGGIWSQQGNKLVGTGANGLAKQGSSVSLSADGNTVIIGGSDDNNSAGAAWIFTRNGNIWTQQGNKLVGNGVISGSRQGASVSLSADGNTAILGGSTDNNQIGAAWVFSRLGNTWSQQGSKLIGSGAIGTSSQGWSVSMSADGNTAMVGGPYDNSDIGAVWVYTRSGSSWIQQGSKLVGTGAVGISRQGWSVNLSADGNTAMVGGNGDNNNIGAAWVFSSNATPLTPPTISSFSPTNGSIGTLVTINGTNLNNLTGITIGGVAAIKISSTSTSLVAMVMPGATAGSIYLANSNGTVISGTNFNVTPTLAPNNQQGNKLVGTGASGGGHQGRSVSISADGNTAVVGAEYDNGTLGAAWVFTRSGNLWSQQGSKLVGTGSVGNSQQGVSVAISADGNTILVGGPNDNSGLGAVWVFKRNGNTWSQQGNKLVGTGDVGVSNQGISVSLSADAKTAIVGGPSDNSGTGAFWIFTQNGSSWSQLNSKLVGTGATGASQQGAYVSISADGKTAIISGPSDNANRGAAWIFSNNANTWSQQGSKLIGSGAVNALQSSVSLSADGNTAVIGGPNDNGGIGAIWVFTRSGNTWSQQGNKLIGSGGIGASNQGNSVSISADGNVVIEGGVVDNGNIGASWVFTRNGNTWSQAGNKMVGNGVSTGVTPFQGSSISLSSDGSTAIVGGMYDNTQIGASWVFVPASSNANLVSLTVNNFTFSPGFNKDILNYTGNVDNNISSITVTPSKEDNNASIQVNVNGGAYTSVTSGNASGSLSLNLGSNIINLRVTAQNTAITKTYTLTVTRVAPIPVIASSANLIADGEVNASIYDALSQRTFVAGDFTAFGNPNSANFAAVNASGQYVPNTLPTINGQVNKILVDGANLYVVGRFHRVGGVLKMGIVRLNAQRQIDLSFNPAIDFPDTSTVGSYEINDIAINGNLIAISGYFRLNGNQNQQRRIALIDKTNGSIYSWSPNISNASDYVYDVEFYNSLLFVGGQFNLRSLPNGSGSLLRRAFAAFVITNPNAVTLSSSFNYGLTNPNGWQPIVYTLSATGTTLYIGGYFEGGNNFSSPNIFSINMTTGSRNSNFNPGLTSPTQNTYNSSYVTSIAAISTNIVFVGGKFYTPSVSGIQRTNFVVLSSTGVFSSSPQFNIADYGNVIIRNISFVNTGANIFRVFLSGPFSSIPSSITRLKGMLAYDFNSNSYSFTLNSQIVNGTPGPITTCFREGNGNFFLGGSFIFAGGTRCPHLAVFNNIGNLDMTTSNSFFMNSYGNMSIRSMALIGSNIYLGGSFKTTNSASPASGRSDLMKISKTTLVKDNNFPQLDATSSNIVNVVVADGLNLYIGGSFAKFLSSTGSQVSKANFFVWNTGTNSIVNSTGTIGGTVKDIAVNTSNVFVAGSFTSPIAGSSAALAKFLKSTMSLQSFPTTNAHSNITSLKVINSQLYVGEKNAIYVYDVSSNAYKAKYNLPTPISTEVSLILPVSSTTFAAGFNGNKLYFSQINSSATFQTYSMTEDSRVSDYFKPLNYFNTVIFGVYRGPLRYNAKGSATIFGNVKSTFAAFNNSFVSPAPPAPTLSASNISFSNIGATDLRFACTSGNGSGRIVLARKGGNPIIPAIFPSLINASSVFGNGTSFGSGTFCVFDGPGAINNLSVTNLQALSSYTFSVLEYNTLGTTRTYNTTSILTGSVSTINFRVPLVCSGILNAQFITANSFTVFSGATLGALTLFVIKQGTNSISFVPSNGTNYFAGQILSDGTKVLSSSGSTSFNVTSLSPGTTYSVASYEYSISGGLPYYDCETKRNFATSSFAPLPQTQSSNINITPSTSSATISWTRGTGGRSLVMISKLPNAPIIANNAISAVNGVSYVGSTDLALSPSNSMLTYTNGSAQNAQVVYHGTGNSVLVNGLNPGSVYQVAVFESNGGGFGDAGQVVYLTSPRPSSTFTTNTLVIAPSSASNLHTILVSQDDARLSWSGGNATNSLVILKKDGPVNFAPTNDNFYTPNASFGLGNQLGVGNYAVYSGNSNSLVNIANLDPDAEYHFAVYDYNAQGLIAKYNSNPYRGIFRTSRAWPVRAGGTKKDAGGGVVTDASGNVYVAGTFEQFGSWGTTSMPAFGGNDIFMTKYSPNGKPIWVARQGGTDADAGSSLALDNSGNLIMTGSFRGTGTFGQGNTLVSNGIDDIFLSKLNPAGNVIWSKRAGGTDQDVAFAITTDNSGNIYIAGYFRGTITFPSSNITMTSLGGTDALIAKYDGSGNLLWAKSGGGIGNDFAYGVSVKGSNVAMVGQFEFSANFDATNLVSAGQSDIFVAEYSIGTGALNWVNKFGGTGADIGFSITTAGSDYVIAGQFSNSVTVGVTTLNSAGNSDVLVGKVNGLGAPVWFKRAGGISQDAGRGIALNSVGDKLFVTGSFAQTASFGSNNLTSFGNLDIFVTTVDLATGDFETTYQNGGPLDDEARGITAATSNTSFITGYFNGQGSFGNVDLTSAGDWDIFVHKFTLVVAPDLANGLVAWYKMNGNAIDASGNGNHGIAQNITPTTDRAGSPNKAYSFQPANLTVDVLSVDPVNVGGTPTTTTSTYLAWIKTAPNFASPNTPKPIFSTSINLSLSEFRSIQLSDIGTLTYCYFGSNSSLQINQNSAAPIQDNSWHHIAVVYKAGVEIIFYVDGIEIGRQYLTNFFEPETFLGAEWNIGQITSDRISPTYSFNGSLDDMRIYRRALTSAEVNFIKNQSATNSFVEESTKTSKLNPEVKLWPNPTNGKLNIDLGTMASNVKLKILDVSGNVVLSNTYKDLNDSYLTLDVQQLSTGYYFAQLDIDGQINTQKLIISK